MPFVVWAAALAALALAVWMLRRRVPAPSDDQGVAHGIERERGLRAGSLRGALEIAGTGALGARAAADVEQRLGGAAILMPAQRQRLGRTLAAGAAAAVVALGLFAVSAARTRDGFAAVTRPIAAWRGLLLPPLAFDALPEEMPRGMPLVVRIRADGRSAVTVSVRAEGESWREERLVVDDSTGLAALDVGPVRAPLTVRVDDGRAPVLERLVAVGDRGWIGDVQVEAVYPAYLGRPAERLELGGVLRVPRGTELRVQAVAYSGARDVMLRYGADSVALLPMGGDAVGARLAGHRVMPIGAGARSPPPAPTAACCRWSCRRS